MLKLNHRADFTRGGGALGSLNSPCFTLAEVLITLGIIGIIAALTIPNLMGAYRRRVVETELKKSYSEFTQIIQRSQADNEDAIYWNWPYTGGMTGTNTVDPEEFFQKYFGRYMKITQTIKQNSENYKVYDSTGALHNFVGDYGNESTKNFTRWHELADGRAVLFSTYTTFNSDSIATKESGTVGRFYVSTTNRGNKKFVGGKNLFSFTLEIRNGKLVPTANAYPVWTCAYLDKQRDTFLELCRAYTGNSGISTPEYCTYIIYCNNWKIPDDYPIKF